MIRFRSFSSKQINSKLQDYFDPSKFSINKKLGIQDEDIVINVQGDGVVGEFPTIEPGESFEYTSGTPLKTNNGIMQGFYLVSQDNGEKLKIDIPAFSLDSPYNKKNVH